MDLQKKTRERKMTRKGLWRPCRIFVQSLDIWSHLLKKIARKDSTSTPILKEKQ